MSCRYCIIVCCVVCFEIVQCNFYIESLSCSDKKACTFGPSCSRIDAMYRAGNLCRKFPYFNGGRFYQDLPFVYGSARESCIRSDGNVCMNWHSHTFNEDNTVYANCSCDQVHPGGLCSAYQCTKHAVQHCEGHPCGNMIQVADGSLHHEKCCVSLYATAERRAITEFLSSCAIDTAVAEADPTVLEESAIRWICHEWPVHHPKKRIREEVVCEQYSMNSSCSSYWTFSDDGDAFLHSHCKCTEFSGPACTEFVCELKKLQYFRPELILATFNPFFMVFITWIALIILHENQRANYCCHTLVSGIIIFFWVSVVGSMLSISLISGGLVGFMLCTGIFITLFYFWCHRKFKNDDGDLGNFYRGLACQVDGNDEVAGFADDDDEV